MHLAFDSIFTDWQHGVLSQRSCKTHLVVHYTTSNLDGAETHLVVHYTTSNLDGAVDPEWRCVCGPVGGGLMSKSWTDFIIMNFASYHRVGYYRNQKPYL